MSRLSLRVSLLILCLAAIGGAAFFLWSSSLTTRQAHDATRAFEWQARDAAIAIADLRAAQQSYVAAGQGEDFWFARVTALRQELDERLSAMRSTVVSPEATAQLDAAAASLQDFSQMDVRAREHTRARELTRASDMIFGDGFELTRKAGDAVERALNAETSARDSTMFAMRRQQGISLAGAAGVVALGMLLLVPRARKRESMEAPSARPSAFVAESPTGLDDLDDFRLPAKAAHPAAVVNLGEVAALCVGLARVADTRSLPALLERTASALNATGIVLWIADPDGRELSPIVVHGYPPQLATRLGTIMRDAENVTASAYRTALLQTVKGDAISSGAIAVPLVSSSGCVGVMAAEMKDGGEQQEPLLAAATIIAAQVATLVGPPVARAKAEAAS